MTSLAAADAGAERDPYARAFQLRLSVGAGGVAGPDRFALSGSFGALIPLGDLVVLEVLGGLGSTPNDDAQRTHVWLRLAAGVRVETRTAPVRAYASARVAHLHDAPAGTWGHHFGESLAGDPSHGLGHLTALGGATGVAWDVPGTARQLVLGAELEILGLVHGAGPESPAAWIDLSVNAAWSFF